MEDRTYSVQITPHAEMALREIAESIAYEIPAPDAAVSWAMKTQAAIQKLSSFPSRVQLTPEEPWHSLGIQRYPVGKYYVYFLIHEEEAKVRVIDIVLQKKDQIQSLIHTPLTEN